MSMLQWSQHQCHLNSIQTKTFCGRKEFDNNRIIQKEIQNKRGTRVKAVTCGGGGRTMRAKEARGICRESELFWAIQCSNNLAWLSINQY